MPAQQISPSNRKALAEISHGTSFAKVRAMALGIRNGVFRPSLAAAEVDANDAVGRISRVA